LGDSKKQNAESAESVQARSIQPSQRAVEVLTTEFIETPRMILRPLREGDRATMTSLLADNRAYVNAHLHVHDGNESDEACFERMLLKSQAAESSGMAVRLACVLRDGRIVGVTHLLNLQMGLTPKADAGWWIGKSFAGNGLASEAVQAMIQRALGPAPRGLGLFQIDAAITSQNVASQRVAQRAGMVRVPSETTSIRVQERWMLHEVWRSRGD
jgi:[ribosomal protein S5]-alanine N-acetyltransferase